MDYFGYESYFYGLYLDFWKLNAAGRQLEYVSTYIIANAEERLYVLNKFPKTWDDIVNFAYLGMDDIFYYQNDQTLGSIKRYQLNGAKTPIVTELADGYCENNFGKSGNLSAMSFSASKSDILMNMYFKDNS